jgi:hypothetical protein
LAGIEPTPPAPKGAGYVRLDHSATVGTFIYDLANIDIPETHSAIKADQIASCSYSTLDNF